MAIGTSDGFLRTYRASDLTAGPFIDLKIDFGGPFIAADDVMTPSVPVQPRRARGRGAVRLRGRVRRVPVFPPAATTRSPTSCTWWTGAFEFNFEFLPIPGTDPAPALAVSQLVTAEPEDAEVLIPTSTNHFLSTRRDMDLTGETASASPRRRPPARSTT